MPPVNQAGGNLRSTVYLTLEKIMERIFLRTACDLRAEESRPQDGVISGLLKGGWEVKSIQQIDDKLKSLLIVLKSVSTEEKK